MLGPMRLFSQFRWPEQCVLRRWGERHDVLPQRSLRYERRPQLPRKHGPDHRGASFREPSPCQWNLPVEAVRRCDKVRRTKSRDSRRGSIRSGRPGRLVELLRALFCSLEEPLQDTAIAFADQSAKLLDLGWLFQGQLFGQPPDLASPYAILREVFDLGARHPTRQSA